MDLLWPPPSVLSINGGTPKETYLGLCKKKHIVCEWQSNTTTIEEFAGKIVFCGTMLPPCQVICQPHA